MRHVPLASSPLAPLNRRELLRISVAAFAGSTLGSSMLSVNLALAAEEPATKSADLLVRGKSAKLTVLEAKPLVFETPLELLDRQTVTPADVLFVRNNQDLAGTATIDSAPLDYWKIELQGLLNRPQSITGKDLQGLERGEYEMVLQCSGNSRSLYSQTAPTKGAQWSQGGMGNVRFAGVPLRTVLKKFDLEPTATARFVTAEGRDQPDPGKNDFEHSLPIEEVLATSIIAFEMNGQPLPAIHGGPVRLITPGYFGTMQLKWLSRLRFEAEESRSEHHVQRYRMPLEPIAPGSSFTSTLTNSRPNWRMPLKTVVFAPLAGTRVKRGTTPIHGVAFNDGRAKLETVLVSTDGGDTWKPANLKLAESRYAWSRWETAVELAAGKQEIWVRALDALGRSQPLDGSIDWNPSGYEWHGVEKIPVMVS